MVPTSRGTAVTLTTIPGQPSEERAKALDSIFGAETLLTGVIFVACYGYAEVWPGNVNVVANNMGSHDMDALLRWNRRREVDSFTEVCQRMIYKHVLSRGRLTPSWLLVIANKADLYWSHIASAQAYYRPGSGSPFDDKAQETLDQLGQLAIDYYVLPLAAEAIDYTFWSSRGALRKDSELQTDQCKASIVSLVETLGELPR
jgi:hypothetical protein